MQNAIKASPQNGVIEIVTSSEKNSFKLHIKNEGGSFSQQQYFQSINTDENAGSLNGLGLKLVDELSGKIGATVFFKTTTENTTWVEVLFPKE